MLRNRFLRLLTTILMGVGLLLIAFWGEKALVNGGSQIPDATLIGAVLITFAVCIIGQFFGDIMNVDACFNCGLFTFLKRLVFFAVVLLALFVGLSLAISYGGVADLLEEGASFFDVVLCSAVAYAPAFALLFYVLEYTVFSSPKVRMPFYFPLAYGAALALGVVSTLIVTFAELQEESIFIVLGLTAVIVIAAIVLCVREDWPFEEYSGYSYGGSYSSYGGSYGGSSSGSYGGSTYSSSDDDSSSNKGSCTCCKYFDSFRKPVGDYGDSATVYYCKYHSKTFEGFMASEGDGGCDNFKSRY